MSAANASERVGVGAETEDLPNGACDPFRLEELAAALGPDGLHQLLDLFVRESAERMRRLREAASGSLPALDHEAHKLWGAAASLGATRMAELTGDLRDAARVGDRATVDQCTKGIAGEVELVAATLAARLRRETCRADG
jgi:HPt (histidine-containing phosphotransfer) domain-containing protein